jgi:hypothetical protein
MDERMKRLQTKTPVRIRTHDKEMRESTERAIIIAPGDRLW